jgi:hypothetical protein
MEYQVKKTKFSTCLHISGHPEVAEIWNDFNSKYLRTKTAFMSLTLSYL